MKVFMKLTVAALVLVNVSQLAAFAYPPECIQQCSYHPAELLPPVGPVIQQQISQKISQTVLQNCLNDCMWQSGPIAGPGPVGPGPIIVSGPVSEPIVPVIN